MKYQKAIEILQIYLKHLATVEAFELLNVNMFMIQDLIVVNFIAKGTNRILTTHIKWNKDCDLWEVLADE